MLSNLSDYNYHHDKEDNVIIISTPTPDLVGYLMLNSGTFESIDGKHLGYYKDQDIIAEAHISLIKQYAKLVA
jgi:hypothetical protein